MGDLVSTFGVMSCAELLRWLRAAEKSGELGVSHLAAERRIHFANGEIVACSTNEPRLQLGPYLVAHGWIDHGALRECMKKDETAGRGLGNLLVETGRISEIDLRSTIIARAKEVIIGLFDWPEGTFRFEVDRKPPDGALTFRMKVEAALLAGGERKSELERIRSAFHAPHRTVQKKAGAPRPPQDLNHLERRLYGSIDGRRSLAEIAEACGTSEHAAGRFLLRQLERGYVEMKDAPAAKTEVMGGATVLSGLRELVAAESYEAAVEWIDRHGLKPGGDDSLTMLIERAETGFLAASRASVPPDAVPHRIAPGVHSGRDADALSSEDTLLLDLIDGTCDVRTLGWIAPLRKVEVVRGLLRLRERGCIELRSRPAHAAGDQPKGERGAVTEIVGARGSSRQS